MPSASSWTAITDHDAVASGAAILIDRGYSDVPPQNGEEIAVAHGASGRVTRVTVVSSAADRLEVSDGRSYFVLKPLAATRPNVLDPDGRYREGWVVA
ncbi:hypothetical protein [Lichenibacterium ramalinae]|uniref:Uncharacterized protein n=1 Tax=Lichenibacterium ramalinae TaxID=2316527 RepID=A0A4Q2RCR4_9HYPH|nr:hypothetical protein [Lichenibacterium ramalinae]RYB02884.1 hypothetical protein D3272_19480 [Lichenibacterium ramalinae]